MAGEIPTSAARRRTLPPTGKKVSVIVLIDTDVLIDLALERDQYVDSAADLLDALERHPGIGFVAWHSIANFYYLVAPRRGKADAKQFVLDLTAFVGISPTTTEHIRHAAQLTMNDFEDAMQVAAAIACNADVIATRNTRDYAKSPVPAAAPAAVVTRLSTPSA